MSVPAAHTAPAQSRLILAVFRRPWLPLLGVLLIYALLILPTVTRQGVSWDEPTDIAIAGAYLRLPDGWLAGSPDDPSQTRLPMAAVAVVYHLLNTSDLITARLVSVLAGALTLVAVYRYGRRRFGLATGVLASALLATSPFFLAFARVAFTETDIYLACALAWLLEAADRLQERFTVGQAAWVGLFLGLALSAKATMLAVLPAIWWVCLAGRSAWQAELAVQAQPPLPVSKRELAFWLAWLLVCLVGGLYVVKTLPPEVYQGWLRLAHYLAVAGGWLLALLWAAWRRHRRVNPFLAALFITALAGLTFFVAPPEHLTNPAILAGLDWRLEHEMAFDPAFILEAAALHGLCLLFKPGVVVGAGIFLALGIALWQWPRRPALRLPVLIVLGYALGLLLLPLAQTFYTIPLLPILALLAADQAVALFARRRRLALGLAALAILSWGSDLALCYPDYNLNGYQWLGARISANRPSAGDRSVVQTPSDGVAQAFEWLNAHAAAGQRVMAYVLPWHIVSAAAPAPPYQIVNGFSTPIDADYIVTEINVLIPQCWWRKSQGKSLATVYDPPFNQAWLEANYVRVFTVQRAFGIEMAAVWQKK